jgi:hypothetical protein
LRRQIFLHPGGKFFHQCVNQPFLHQRVKIYTPGVNTFLSTCSHSNAASRTNIHTNTNKIILSSHPFTTHHEQLSLEFHCDTFFSIFCIIILSLHHRIAIIYHVSGIGVASSHNCVCCISGDFRRLPEIAGLLSL